MDATAVVQELTGTVMTEVAPSTVKALVRTSVPKSRQKSASPSSLPSDEKVRSSLPGEAPQGLRRGLPHPRLASPI